MGNTDVTALGEVLIDFTQNGADAAGNPVLTANPGGAPGNVLAMLKKLGRSCSFIGKVGKDAFGDFLETTLQNAGIDTGNLVRDEKVHTTLAFVHTLEGGERSFSFYRDPGADMMLTKDEVDESLIKHSRIFHFGSLSLTDEPCREATAKAVRVAKEASVPVSFDPNLRESLWSSPELAKEQIEWGLERCDILKISDNEAVFMTGERNPEKAAEKLIASHPGIKLMTLTLGEEGSVAFYAGKKIKVPAVEVKNPLEKTGAGDTFCACVLNGVLEHGLEGLEPETVEEILTFASAAASIVIQRKGALRSMPERKEIEDVLKICRGK